MKQAWSALLAPFGVAFADGRLLEPAGRWALRTGAPLLCRSNTIGAVQMIVVSRRHLYAFGYVTDDDAAARMFAREMYPALNLDGLGANDVGFNPNDATMRFRGGTVTAIDVVQTPCWDVYFQPGGMTFTGDDEIRLAAYADGLEIITSEGSP